MGQALNIDLHSDSKYTPEYLADMELSHPPKETLRLPMTPVLKQTFLRNMETPYSVTAIPSKLESRYRTVPCKESCLECGVHYEATISSEGQPVFMDCPFCVQTHDNDHGYNFTWYKNDSTTSFSMERHARVYSDGRMIKFVPARLEDSGFYDCIARNSVNCSKKSVHLIIYKNDDGLCYNKEQSYLQTLYAPNDKVVCTGISYFKDKNVKIKWYKDCKPLNDSRFQTIEFNLVATNLTVDDKGFYTCEISFEYDGKIYNISNTINMTVKVIIPEPSPVIINPTNGSIEAELGSNFSLPCNVSCRWCDVNWWINYTLPELYSSRYIKGGDYIDTILQDGTRIRTKYLRNTDVKKEDYDQIFICLAKTSKMATRVYVSLKPPDTILRRCLIGIFTVFGLVIILTEVMYKIFKIEIVLCYRKYCLPLTYKGVSDGKLYDGYVIYPKSNKPIMAHMNIFVLKMMPEVLEKQCGYKLFIFGRDELPGEAKANLIDEIIKQSRRVLIILIKKEAGNLFDDGFEQDVALYNALIHNKDKVILIEAENIKDYTSMPESIKYIKEKRGAIRWTGDVTDRALSANTKFWKNVRYQMPPIPSSQGEMLLRVKPYKM
uniref:Interleukin-1 receptor type 1-like n=1 Tax=Geotrypetes seraphini TaxID=260995 RepID=A0A6P8RAN9_GEOSA|nr:interleukin-1 receptor type 1-like [Geotrypetes seraphini]